APHHVKRHDVYPALKVSTWNIPIETNDERGYKRRRDHYSVDKNEQRNSNFTVQVEDSLIACPRPSDHYPPWDTPNFVSRESFPAACMFSFVEQHRSNNGSNCREDCCGHSATI